MKFLAKIAWWGLDRRIVLRINEAENLFQGELTFDSRGEAIVRSREVFGSPQALCDWAGQWPELPVFLELILEEVVVGSVDESSTDWMGDILGVKVAQPSLFWYQVKAASEGRKSVAIVRKAVLEKKMSIFSALDNRLVALSLFSEINASQRLDKAGISQPKQLYSNKVNFIRSQRICRLAVAVSCCCLVASLCFFLVGKRLDQRTHQNQQQITAFHSQLDSIRQNEASITSHSLLLEQSRKMAPSAFSYYADQIAALAPDQLTFTELVFAPDKKERKKVSSLLKHDSLDFILRGSASEAVAITDFSSAMKELEIIGALDLRETSFDREMGVYHFNLTGKWKGNEE
jgi:hypothetical protein